MSKIKKYWRGNIRIVSDLFWSCAINAIVTYYQEVKGDIFDSLAPENALEYMLRFMGGVAGIFLSTFFWSWNSQHIKDKFAKYAIHSLFGFNVLAWFLVFVTGALQYFKPTSLVFILIVQIFVVRKYIRLLWLSDNQSILKASKESLLKKKEKAKNRTGNKIVLPIKILSSCLIGFILLISLVDGAPIVVWITCIVLLVLMWPKFLGKLIGRTYSSMALGLRKGLKKESSRASRRRGA